MASRTMVLIAIALIIGAAAGSIPSILENQRLTSLLSVSKQDTEVYRSRLETANSRLSSSEAEAQQLKAEVNDLREKSTTTLDQLRLLNLTKESLSTDLETARLKLTSLEMTNQRLNSDVDDFAERLRRVEAQRDALLQFERSGNSASSLSRDASVSLGSSILKLRTGQSLARTNQLGEAVASLEESLTLYDDYLRKRARQLEQESRTAALAPEEFSQSYQKTVEFTAAGIKYDGAVRGEIEIIYLTYRISQEFILAEGNYTLLMIDGWLKILDRAKTAGEASLRLLSEGEAISKDLKDLFIGERIAVNDLLEDVEATREVLLSIRATLE